jgi:hypothetical protein
MVLVPIGSVEVVYSAPPEIRVNVVRMLVPSTNSTFPVGVPAEDVTVAVKLTVFPDTDGFTEETSVTTGVALFTTWDKIPEALPVKLESPLYTAEIECVPIERLLVIRIAALPLTETVPSTVEPSLNVIVPVA